MAGSRAVVSPLGPIEGVKAELGSSDFERRVKRFAPLTLALLVLPSVALATDGSHEETLRLNQADLALAKRAAVHKPDLVAGWRLVQAGRRKTTGSDPCPGFDPDLSAFVITGTYDTAFSDRTGAQILSHVAVFRNARDAALDFKATAKPALLRCIRSAEMQSYRQADLRAKITSSRLSLTPRLGDQSVAYRVDSMIYPANGVSPFPMYSDFLVFRQGRPQAVIVFIAPFSRMEGRAPLARMMLRRMR